MVGLWGGDEDKMGGSASGEEKKGKCARMKGKGTSMITWGAGKKD